MTRADFDRKDRSAMQNVLLVAYLLIVLALIAVILLQRSEGGGLGMGSGSNGFMTVRGTANLLTRTTGILAALFFATAIGLTILSELDRGTTPIFDNSTTTTDVSGPQPSTVLDALSLQQGDTSSATTDAVSSAAPTDPGLALPITDTPAPSTAPTSSAAPESSAASAPSSAPAQ